MGLFNGWFHSGVGIDLGTANTLIYVENHGVVLSEPSVIAIDSHNNLPFAVGRNARAMLGRTPQGIRASRPLKHGVIAELADATFMLNEFMKRVADQETKLRNPEIVIAIPVGITSVERIAIKQVAENAKASKIYMPNEPMCAAIGAELPVTEPTGSMVVDIGGGTTEVTVISLNGIVVSESLRLAGDDLDEAIQTYMRKVRHLAIGEKTAEEVKFRLGSAWPAAEEDYFEVRGLGLKNGLPSTVTVVRSEIREAIAEPVAQIVEAVKSTIAKTPPELAADIHNHGLFLTGGGALLQGLDERISSETEVPVFIADEPISCVARGTGKLLSDPLYSRIREQSEYSH